jgi:PAS domain S-box-containing protein
LCDAQAQQFIELNFRILTPEGDIRWIERICTSVYNKSGQWLGCRASNRDVTRRKRLEEELQQVSTRLSLAVRAGGVGIWDYDVSHNNLIWDDQMFRLYGITADQFSGAYEAWTDGVHPEDRARGDEEIKMAIRGEKEFDTEFRVLWPDGTTHYIRAMASVQRNAAGQGVRIIGTNWDITEHRLAEAMLARNRLRLENIIDATHVGTWEWNVQTGETVFNETWAQIIGYTLDELAPVSIKTWEKFAHPDDLKQSVLLLEKHFAGELPYYDYECRMKHKNGHWVWVHDRGRVVTRTADGKPLLMFGNHTELIKSNAYLENLVNCANAPIIVWDSQFHIMRFNHAFELLTGRSEEEVLEQSLDILFPPALAPKTVALIHQTATGERWEAVEIEILHRDRTIRTVLWNSATLFAPDGKTPIATIAQGQDITASKFADKLLRASQARFEALAVQSRTVIWETNADGLYTYISPVIEQILGYREIEIIGKKHFYDLHPEFGREEFKTAAFAVFRSKESFLNLENIVQAKDGHCIWFSTNGIPVLDADGKLLGYRGSDTDITERVKSQQELIHAKERAEESDQLKTAFLTNVSHEIRTPMNGILGFAELLQEENLSVEEQQEYINIIQISGKRMLNTISDIISIAKIESGQMSISLKKTNINEQLDYIYAFFKHEAAEKKLELILKTGLTKNAAVIETDQEKLYGILTNLVKNAIKFTETGTIEFGYECKGEFLEFYVKDHGIGIPANRQKAIFERFVQADISDKRAYQGSGLGLSISKAYVEMLGGRIWVESEDGKGSIFYFTIPNIAAIEEKRVIENAVQADMPAEEKDDQIRPLKILIAEDDEQSEALITIAVKKLAREILKVKTGVDAVAVCRNNPDIDLVLMDVKMPKMDGHEATIEIRQFNKDVVIIAQTAYALEGDREQAIAAGCNDYFTKPYNQATLAAILKKYF